MYKGTLVRLRLSTLAWKSDRCYIFWVCIRSLSHPANNAHAQYYIVIRGLS